jgi:hypothetical protein
VQKAGAQKRKIALAEAVRAPGRQRKNEVVTSAIARLRRTRKCT